MKKYIIFAGVNGAGKSTLYNVQYNYQNMPRVNTDEILREFGDWRNIADLLKAGKIAVTRMKDYLNNGLTFNQETTLCGKAIIRTINEAKERGYCIELHYVGIDSVELAKERIALRVHNGGHGIADADVEKRYEETFVNLKKVLPICDLVVLYDNTENFRRFAIYKNGEAVRLSRRCPEWYYKKIMNKEIY